MLTCIGSYERDLTSALCTFCTLPQQHTQKLTLGICPGRVASDPESLICTLTTAPPASPNAGPFHHALPFSLPQPASGYPALYIQYWIHFCSHGHQMMPRMELRESDWLLVQCCVPCMNHGVAWSFIWRKLAAVANTHQLASIECLINRHVECL